MVGCCAGAMVSAILVFMILVATARFASGAWWPTLLFMGPALWLLAYTVTYSLRNLAGRSLPMVRRIVVNALGLFWFYDWTTGHPHDERLLVLASGAVPWVVAAVGMAWVNSYDYEIETEEPPGPPLPPEEIDEKWTEQ